MTDLPRRLGDGLVLRRARSDDAAELAEFNAAMHADDDLPGDLVAAWTLDLFDLPHPTFDPTRDVTVVEDEATARIVSALFLIPQWWDYDGLRLPVAQPELIATHPENRRRGLVRAQFEVVHRWSDDAGHRFQVIAGIAWYYRQFGYSYALDLPPRPFLPLDGDAPPPVDGLTIRPATDDDVAFLTATEVTATSGTTLGPHRGEDGFRLELARRPGSLERVDVSVIESAADGPRPVGYLVHEHRLRDGVVSLRAVELEPGRAWPQPVAAVVAHLHAWLRKHPDGPGRGVRVALPDGHPVRRCLTTRLTTPPPGTYGLYVRIPEVTSFLGAVAPVLERRLAASPAVGWTGHLRLDLYTGGVELVVDQGRLRRIDTWTPPGPDGPGADASLRVDELVHLLLGNRSITVLEREVPDCDVRTDIGALLLDVLFPPMAMSTWELC